jgi:hypothetical protein
MLMLLNSRIGGHRENVPGIGSGRRYDAGGHGHFAGRRRKTPAAPDPIIASQALSHAQTTHERPLPQKLALPVVLQRATFPWQS